MPRLFLFLSALMLTVCPIAADKTKGEVCPQCDTSKQEIDSTIMRGNNGQEGLFEIRSIKQDCLKPSGSSHPIWINGKITSYFFLKPAYIEKGISRKQANFSFHHPDSLTFVSESKKTTYTGPRRFDFLKIMRNDQITKKGVLCIKDAGTLRLTKKEISSYSHPVLAKNVFYGLIVILFFGSLCAFLWPTSDKSAINSWILRLIWLIFFIVLAIITAIEARNFFQAASLSLPMSWSIKLTGPNLGLTLGLFFMAIAPFWTCLKDRVVVLGFITILETIIFIGLQTESLTTSMFYFCISLIPFFVINFLPFFFRNKKTAKPSTK
jgi:hypothetical protein